jgi:hypothetical protein
MSKNGGTLLRLLLILKDEKFSDFRAVNRATSCGVVGVNLKWPPQKVQRKNYFQACLEIFHPLLSHLTHCTGQKYTKNFDFSF